MNINLLTKEARQDLMRRQFGRISRFQELFSKDYQEFDCQEWTDSFRKEIERILFDKQIIAAPILLEDLHQVVNAEMRGYNFNDGVNKISTFFYDTDEKFTVVYHGFIKFLREKIFKQPFWFQATPTIRIQCPDGENSNHYPRYHTDIGYGHPPEEINIWFPLTEKREGHGFRFINVDNSVKILEKFNYDFESFIDKAINDKILTRNWHELSSAVETEKGKMFAFDSRCIHTGEPLQLHTRVSMDIRILPLEDFETMDFEYQGTGRRKILFIPGHCYYSLSSDQL